MEFEFGNFNREVLDKFEKMIESDDSLFFDVGELEYVITHYLQTGNLKKATSGVEYGLQLHPNSQELLMLKVQVLTAKNEFEEALFYLEDLPDYLNTEVNLAKGLIYIKCERYDQAIQLLKKALTLDPENSELFYTIGYAFQSKQNYHQAIKYYKRSVELDMSNELALYELAFCLEITNRLEEAIPFYQKFIDADPYAENAWYNLGTIYHQLGKPKEAMDAFEFAIAIEPEFSSAYFNLANIQFECELYSDAIQNFEDCLEHESPSAEVYCKIGECYEQLENLDLAFEFYKKALKIDKTKEEALIGLGSILYERDKMQEAIYFVSRAKEVNPTNPGYWHLLANCEFRMGNEASCLEAFQTAIELETSDSKIWLDYSFIYYDKGEYESAHEVVKQGLEYIPESAELYYMGFVFALKAGNIKESLIILENALILDPDKKDMVFEYFQSLEEQKAILHIMDKVS